MRRLLIGMLAAAMLAGVAVVAPSIVTPEKAPQAAAHGDGTNGCSVPGNPSWKDTPGGFYFHSACDGHDRSYINRPYGANELGRSTSDWFFLEAMRSSCRSYPWALQRCYDWAWRYYSAVRAAGWWFYYRYDKWARANVTVFFA